MVFGLTLIAQGPFNKSHGSNRNSGAKSVLAQISLQTIDSTWPALSEFPRHCKVLILDGQMLPGW